MSYALNAYMPYEGYRVAFNGEKGRLDVQSFERQPWEVADSHEIYVTKSFGKRTKVPMPKMTAGHGGGDHHMRGLIFTKLRAPQNMKDAQLPAGAQSWRPPVPTSRSNDREPPVRHP